MEEEYLLLKEHCIVLISPSFAEASRFAKASQDKTARRPVLQSICDGGSSTRSEEVDFKKLKELTQKIGGILVFEGEKPELVILPYQVYRELEQAGSTPAVALEQESARTEGQPETFTDVEKPGESQNDELLIDALNKEILILKEKAKQKEEEELSKV